MKLMTATATATKMIDFFNPDRHCLPLEELLFVNRVYRRV